MTPSNRSNASKPLRNATTKMHQIRIAEWPRKHVRRENLDAKIDSTCGTIVSEGTRIPDKGIVGATGRQ